MAIYPFSNAYVINKDGVAGSSFKSGMVLMINSDGKVVAADPQLYLYKNIEQLQSIVVGFAAGDSNTTGNTIIVPDYIGSNYLDSSSKFVSISDREYVTVRRQLLDYADETVNDYYNINYSPKPKRTGIGVYPMSGDSFATDQFVPVLHGDFGIDSIFTQVINPGDFLTIGSGINAGKLVKVNLNSIGKDILVVGVVERYDTNTRLLYFKSSFYTVKFSSNSAVLALDAGNSLSFPNTGSIGTVCGTVGESGSFTLTAPVGHVFDKVIFASYGTPEGLCGNFSTGGCHASNSQSIVEGLLLGNSSVTLTASNGVFGDPCGGTPKRLYVQARFAPTLAKDLTTFNNNGTLTNGVTYDTAGGGSWSFDGTNDYIQNGIFSAASFSTISLSLWFYKPNSWPNQYGKLFILGNSGQTALFLSHGPLVDAFYFGVGLSVSGQLSATIGYPSVNQWHLATGTWDGTNLKFYIDGVLAVSKSGSGTFPGIYDASGFKFGYGYGSEYFQGNITDVRLYNRSLTATEILAYYNNTKARFGL